MTSLPSFMSLLKFHLLRGSTLTTYVKPYPPLIPRPLTQLSFLPGPHRCLFIIALIVSPLARIKTK